MDRNTVSAPESFHTEAGARWNELFLYLEKAFYMNDSEEAKTLHFFAFHDAVAARLWLELIRQRKSGMPH